MKRGFYKVRSYDGSVEKNYKNYESAVKYCNRLIARDIWCGIYVFDYHKQEMVCIIGC